MIQAIDVVKYFDDFEALRGLSLNVPKGAVYGLVGPNGSGKSTIIKHFAGIYRQNSGEVLVDGEPVFENTAVKEKIGYIPDDPYSFPQASTRDMMKFYKGIYPKFDTDRYFKLRDVFEFDEKRTIRKLSKGMQKQSAFWLELCMHPEVLILDEPVDGLDPVMRRQIWSLVMGEVAEHGTTVLVSSHNLRELEDVCDHVGIIMKGKNVLEQSLSQLQENISKVQLVPKDGAELPEGLDILHESSNGKIKTLIVRGNAENTDELIRASEPVFYDMVPLSLEEIFIYELGGKEYAVKDIIL